MPLQENQSEQLQVEKPLSSNVMQKLICSKSLRGQRLRQILELITLVANYPVVQTQSRLVGLLSTAGVKTAELCLIYEATLQTNAIHMVCPVCHSAIGMKCLQKKKDGLEFIENFHEERIEAYFKYMEEKCKE